MMSKTTPKTRERETLLPLSRIRTVMKSSPDAGNVSQEGLIMVCKATEMFVTEITKLAFEKTSGKRLDYNDLSQLVDDESDRLDFLGQIIPKKITGKKYKEILENASSESDDTESESSDSDSSSSSSGEESDDEGEEESEKDSVIELSSSGDESKKGKKEVPHKTAEDD